MPYGDGVFYVADDEGKRRTFVPLSKQHDASRRCSFDESAWVQSVALEKFPAATRIFSFMHAGPGQLSFGGNGGRAKVDALLTFDDGLVLACQYHSRLHYYGHTASCARNAQRKEREEMIAAGMPPPEEEEEDEICLYETTVESDENSWKYARALTKAFHDSDLILAKRLRFQYNIYMECDEKLHPEVRRKTLNRLHKKHGKNCVGLCRPEPSTPLTEDGLLKKLLYDDKYTGFVGIEGGYESAGDTPSLQTGFCMSRFVPQNAVQELGEGAVETKNLQDESDSDLVERKLKAEIGTLPVTAARHSYPKHELTVMSVGLFRWMVKERRLTGFRLRHYLRYDYRHYLRPIVADFMKQRQKLKMEGGGGGLKSQLLKVVLNSLYGFLFMEKPRFFKTNIASLTKSRKRLANDDNVVRTLPVGVTSKDLLVMTVSHTPDESINNAAQVATQILSCSKTIFFSHLLFLLRCFCPSKAELCYLVSALGQEKTKKSPSHFSFPGH